MSETPICKHCAQSALNSPNSGCSYSSFEKAALPNVKVKIQHRQIQNRHKKIMDCSKIILQCIDLIQQGVWPYGE